MIRLEAQQLVHRVVHDWLRESGNEAIPAIGLHASDFIDWLRDRYPQALEFRSTMGPIEDIAQWFDQEMKLTWQN